MRTVGCRHERLTSGAQHFIGATERDHLTRYERQGARRIRAERDPDSDLARAV
jgi:YD repeat-containing protein